MSDQSNLLIQEALAPCVPEVGEWGVWTGWSYEVGGPITSVTARMVGVWQHGRERRRSRADLVFTGTEQACRDLSSVLIGSAKKKHEAVSKAHVEHVARVAKAVAWQNGRKDGSRTNTNGES